MKCLSEKLGSKSIKDLVLHNDGERPVIFYPALRGKQKLLEKMLNYLTVKDRKKSSAPSRLVLGRNLQNRRFSLITGT
jgi:hypothetical protein